MATFTALSLRVAPLSVRQLPARTIRVRPGEQECVRRRATARRGDRAPRSAVFRVASALKMSRHVFAFKIGVNPRTLERWEQGRSKPNEQAAAP